jgi:uncharacterized protein (DUF1697 family)
MAELRALLVDLGATDVRTYIASGNAVCVVPGDSDAFDRALEVAIEQRFGFFREVISRTPGELSAALAAHPFEVIEPGFSYVSFLTAEPPPAAIEAAREVAVGDDLWQVIGRELHLRYANGAGRPNMNTDAVMHRLGVVGTARNLRTVAALVAHAE